MRIALARTNPIIGDVGGNTQLLLDAIEDARAAGADLLVTAELSVIGYPPRDLLLREGVVDDCQRAVKQIADAAGGITVLVGHPRVSPDGGRRLRNSCSVCRDGRVEAVYDKRLLPGYDVFDEDRYFEPGHGIGIVEVAGRRIGLMICEDFWRGRDVIERRATSGRYAIDPLLETVEAGCDLVFMLNASPFVIGKAAGHTQQFQQLARAHRTPIVAVNQLGANDDLIFDGRCVVVDAGGRVVAETEPWQSGVHVVDLEPMMTRGASSTPNGASSNGEPRTPDEFADLFHALRLGVADYFRKTGHTKAIIGLSGGIDSAIVATLAAAALGPANVVGVLMPSRYSSAGSIHDARALAEGLGLEQVHTIAIRDLHPAVASAIEPITGDVNDSLTDENLQARLRGLLLMAVSNATGGLVLATSNKSEMAAGYTTLYGDMVGALSVIGDVLKTQVYDLARWINAHAGPCGFDRAPIPQSSIDKPASAELRADQTDQDTLPPYTILDDIIRRRVDGEQSVERIIEETGFDRATVERFARQIDISEFKRNQAAVVLKVSPRAFGPGRPMPIVMKQTTASSDHRMQKAGDVTGPPTRERAE